MSAGSFWRSPSIGTITSPRAWSKPADMAAVWPKLRRSWTSFRRGSRAARLVETRIGLVIASVVHNDDLERSPEGFELSHE